MKRILLAGMFVLCGSVLANVEKEVTVNNGEVTIIKNDGRIDLSILNTKNNTYTIHIYNPNGDLVYKDVLGSETSIGRRFDFDWALEGKYIFKLTNSNGERTSYTVNSWN